MATTLDTQGNQIVNGFSTNLPPTSTISADKLNPTTPIQITAPQTPDYASVLKSNVAELGQQAQNAQTQYEQQLNEAKNLSSNKSSLEALLSGKAAETATSYETGGVNKAAEQLRQLNAQAVGLQNEASAIPIQIQQGATGQGVTDRGVAPIQTARLRENALKALSLGQQAAIAQADYATAKDKADQLINMKYAGIESDIKAKQTQLDALEKYTLTPAEQNRLEATKKATDFQAQQLADKKANDKAINDLMINASQVAPPDVLARAKVIQEKGGSSTDVAMALGQYGGDYYKQALLKEQIESQKSQRLTDAAQRAKIASDISVNKAQVENYLASAAKTKGETVGATGTDAGVGKGLDQINLVKQSLKNALAVADASGRSGARKTAEGAFIGATDYTNLVAETNTLRTNVLTMMTDPTIKKFFGPQMSNADVQLMTAAGTTLNPELQTPEKMKEELNRLADVAYRAENAVRVGKGLSPLPATDAPAAIELRNKLIKSNPALAKQPFEGTSIINTVTNSGIDFKIPTK